ncbi:MAG: 50S ribosomal protein L25 [Chlamydiae bacterium CG10_big_fil_rev_8_21_14_0_10_42_34]|nr:MAG: 50S ribosomal protein L25 [Chlamydiae bacterium CG10_big_fil_rev_8_21_14_0_10_42_34]
MKLEVQKRTTGKKGIINKLRREGHIPGILYSQGGDTTPVHIKAEEFQTILRNMKPGLLSTTVFELHEGNNKHKAIIKDLQYHVATYDLLHIDFAILTEDKPITVNVPIQLHGVIDCVGVKLGGFLRQVIRSMKVSCLPKHIPQQFIVDVTDLNIAQSRRLSDIPLPENVRPLGKLNEVAVIIGKKAGT